MPACKECGKKVGFFDIYEGHCPECIAQIHKLRNERRNDDRTKAKQEQQKLVGEIEAVLLTTETAPNLNITRRIEIVTAECAFGMNIFKDLFAGVRDIVGGRSEAVQKTMRDARKTALYELKREAHLVGANAVVGVDLDYVELSASGSMIMLVASGTAVIIDEQV